MEVKIEHRLNVDEKQHDKILKVKSDIDDSDEVLKKNPASRAPMKNRPVCVICNQTLALKNRSKSS